MPEVRATLRAIIAPVEGQPAHAEQMAALSKVVIGWFSRARHSISLRILIPTLKPGLPEFGGLIRVHPRNQIGFFQEITPAVVSNLVRSGQTRSPSKDVLPQRGPSRWP